MKSIQHQHGLTLLELIIVLSIASILLVIAVPSFDQSSKSNSVKALQRNYLSALSYARGESVARNKAVSMCPSSDGNTCQVSTASWSGGWLVFVDDSSAGFANGIYDSGEELLRANNYDGNAQLIVRDAESASFATALSSLSWNYRGFMRNDSRVLFVFCDRDDTAINRRGLLVERSGRIMMTSDRDDNGVHDSVFAGLGNADLISCN